MLNRFVSTRKNKLLTGRPESLRQAICNLLESSLQARVGCRLAWGRGRESLGGRAQTKQLAPQQSRCARGQRALLQGGQGKREKGAQQRNGTGRMGRAVELRDRGFRKGPVLGGGPPGL